MGYVLGIDVGGTNVRLGLVDREYNLFDFEIIKTKELFQSGVAKFSEYVNDYINKRSKYTIDIISIGFPSTMNKERTVIYSTPNIKVLKNINVKEVFDKYFSIPFVIEKDVNLMLKYDIYDKNLPSGGIIIGFYVGTGLGNSIIINGEFLKGRHGVAGELGHMPSINNERVCACGNIGCLETITSGKYIVDVIEKKYSDVNIRKFFSDPKTKEDAMVFLENLSIPIASEINVFDPHFVFIGGGVIDMDNFPKETLIRNIINHTRKPYPAEDVNIMFTKGNQTSGVIGAGIYGFERLGSL